MGKIVRVALTESEAMAVNAMMRFYIQRIEDRAGGVQELPALYHVCKEVLRKLERGQMK